MTELKKLGDVCSFTRGKTITAKNAIPGNIPVIAGGQTPSYYHNYSNRTGESIVIAGSGAYAGFVSYWNQPIFVSDAFTVNPLPSINKKYVYHWLKMHQAQIYTTQKGAGVPHVHGKDIAQFEIPIPSLSEQKHIVGILDTFTSSIDNLKEQIAQHRKQFEYYRDQLLENEDFNAKVNKVASFGEGRIMYSELNEYNYVSVENLLKDKAGKTISLVVPSAGKWPAYFPDDILIGNIRPYLRKIWLANNTGGTNGDVVVVRPNELILPRFLYITLSSERFFNYYNQTAKGGKMPRGDKKQLLNFDIYLPHLSEQNRIVGILDTFEASIKNLEAQLELRQKQYEYYRNKLLTFD